MWILPLVGYIGFGIGFGFLTLAIASGLYYLSELVEEHTVVAKKLLTRLIYGVIGLQALLCLVDGFPFMLSMLSISSHIVYLGNMRRFPFVKLSDPLFISSCSVYPEFCKAVLEGLWANVGTVLVLLNHYLWFTHFSFASLVATPASRYDPSNLPTFTEIASYFGLCVWLVPFSLFVSLSASDNVLPTMGSEAPGIPGASRDGKNKRQGMFKVVIDVIRDWMGEVGRLAGYNRPDRGF
ncbi:transmembrane adaptor Erv26 [Drepanopeziza brunnea f. sp. 'multigermtubi' MB_m1]|uniref:Transmembrane adaptor Erv26 n=1 Tax=Marssonina brunnea f. sp. multigermtubi (strain MB_m1) TaxID=1072389 RepID=K1X960_MARBU|nr:transmembrane adaptor Erv26 [Drepanopeziza brunnea f. sp. 'multigermtubi' MB_m1]EKD17268.1 transmembrane adaptor Erv26 [Drepanopeziza brunnea f. sp. 'multigermtubi' MB_m1]